MAEEVRRVLVMLKLPKQLEVDFLSDYSPRVREAFLRMYLKWSDIDRYYKTYKPKFCRKFM